MKIVMICEFYDEKLEYQENLLTKYYAKNGHAVTVITSTFDSVFDYYADRHDKNAPARTFFDGKAKIIKLRYRYNLLNRLRAYTRIDVILDEEKPDLIYVHDISPNFPEAIAYIKRHPATRMIMDYHADYSNSGRNWVSIKILHGVLRKWFLDRARPYMQRIFPVVPAGATFLHEVYGVPHAEMEVLPLGADADLIADVIAKGEGKALRARYGIPADARVIFTGGKLAPAKKTEMLIEALDDIPGDPVHLVVIGEASKEDAAYKDMLVAEAAGNPRIRFAGWLDKADVYRHLAMADLAVFPASQSVIWKQSIASGLPLIVGDTGHQDISYLNLHDNIIILRSEEIRADSIAKAIASVFNDPTRMAEMRAGARLVGDEHLNWDRLIERTLRYNKQPVATNEAPA